MIILWSFCHLNNISCALESYMIIGISNIQLERRSDSDKKDASSSFVNTGSLSDENGLSFLSTFDPRFAGAAGLQRPFDGI